MSSKPSYNRHVCCRCQRESEAAVPVRDIERVSGPGFTLYACPDCVHLVPPGPLMIDDLLYVGTRR
jgi:hypothetical protein